MVDPIEDADGGNPFDVIYPPDLDAGREAAQARRTDDPAHDQDKLAALYAKLHANWGPANFQLMLGNAGPRHPAEKLNLDLFRQEEHSNTNEYEPTAETVCAEPLTKELLRFLMDDVRVAIGDYSQVLVLVNRIVNDQQGQYPSEKWEPIVSYHARELVRPTSFFSQQLEVFIPQIADLRAEAGKSWVVSGPFNAVTAFGVANQLLNHVSKAWFTDVDISRRSQTENDKYLYSVTASELFWNESYASLPAPREILNRIHEEETLVRIALRDSHRSTDTTVNVHVPVNVSPQIEFNPNISVNIPSPVPLSEAVPDTAPAPDTSSEPSKARTKATKPDQRPQLARWAIGLESHNSWWLYQEFRGVWRQYGKVSIPDGHAEQIMQLLARGGGAIDTQEAIDCLCADAPGVFEAQKIRRVTDALSKAKQAIKEAISVAGGYDRKLVGNPIPHVAPGWRAVIQIGYAVQTDDGKLAFRLQEDLGRLEI